MSKVRKRDGSIVEFDKSKIEKAILKSMKNGSGIVRPQIAANIADEIAELYIESETPVEISAIEQLVFNKLIAKKQKLTARAYESYRSIREFQREHNTIDMDVIGIVNGANAEVLTNNSNKNENLISTSRDLVAEEVSKDYARRKLLPPHIVQAHDEGLIYIHDLGHYMNPSINCLEEHTWIDIKKDGKISRVQMKDLIDILHLNPDGTSTIDDIVYVRDNKGWTRLIAVKRRKSPREEKLYKFLTATGIPLICTGRHRIPVLRGNEIVLSEASDITAYDSLLKTNNYNATFNYFDLTELSALTDDIRVTNLERFDSYLKYRYDTCLFALEKKYHFERYSHSKYKLYLKDFKAIIKDYPVPFDIYSTLRVSIKGGKHSFPLVIPYSDDLAKLYAYIYADGGVYINEQQGTYAVTFTNTNMALMTDFARCFENVFDEKVNILNPSGTSPCYRISLGSRLLTYLFKDYHGANKHNAGEMSIPNFVKDGDIQYKLAYLSAAIDTDGTVLDNAISYATSSENYAMQIKSLIESLGYKAGISKGELKGSEYNVRGIKGYRNYDNYYVQVYADASKLKTLLYSYKVKKRKENLSVVDLTNIPTDKLISIETNYTDCCVMDLQTESNYYIANDYLVHNCQLVDLKDMLDNGTCINKKLIESPHRFLTACTIATQIAAQVASEQFGGQTMSVSHLAPYLRKSRKKIEEKLRAELDGLVSDEVINKLIDERLHEELSSGVQTFNYQLNTLQTSNGFLNSGRCKIA